MSNRALRQSRRRRTPLWGSARLPRLQALAPSVRSAPVRSPEYEAFRPPRIRTVPTAWIDVIGRAPVVAPRRCGRRALPTSRRQAALRSRDGGRSRVGNASHDAITRGGRLESATGTRGRADGRGPAEEARGRRPDSSGSTWYAASAVWVVVRALAAPPRRRAARAPNPASSTEAPSRPAGRELVPFPRRRRRAERGQSASTPDDVDIDPAAAEDRGARGTPRRGRLLRGDVVDGRRLRADRRRQDHGRPASRRPRGSRAGRPACPTEIPRTTTRDSPPAAAHRLVRTRAARVGAEVRRRASARRTEPTPR